MVRTFFAALALLFAAPLAWSAIELLPGSTPQVRSVGTEFAPIRVRVTDESGQPVAGATLKVSLPWSFYGLGFAVPPAPQAWKCISDLGTTCEGLADSRGEATLPVLYSSQVGNFEVRLTASSPSGTLLGSATATLIAEALAALPRLEAARGNGQAVVQGGRLEPFVVRFVDGEGRPIAGVQVGFTPWGGAGIFLEPLIENGGSLATDSDGYAQSPRFTATQALGEGQVSVSARIPGSYLNVYATLSYRVTTPSGAASLDLQDMWWGGPQESGWAISVAQDGHVLFPVLYAYDAAGEPTWYVGLNDLQSSYFFATAYYRYNFSFYSPRSAPYYAYDASRFQLGFQVMGLHFSFDTPSDLKLTAYLPGREGVVKQLRRQDFTSDVPTPITGLGGMWWGGPAQNGWGISLMEQPGGLFAVWATYGDDGRPTWFVMDSGTWTSDRTWEGRIVRPSGPRWPDFDTARLRLEDVGTFKFDFHDRTHATFTWSVGARRGVEAIERMPL